MLADIQKNTITLIFKGLLILAVFIAGSFLLTNIVHASGNVSGFAWGASDTDGDDLGDYGPGWIGLNCDVLNTCSTVDWGVGINFSGVVDQTTGAGPGEFYGHAWSNNIGYITFDASEVTGCPIPVNNSCTPRVTDMTTGAI